MGLSQTIGDAINSGVKNFGNWLGGLWDDWTGKSAVDLQNQGNLDMAKYQQQVEEELYNKYRSPAAIMQQYKDAGLNPNLIYGSASAGIGGSPHFNAPHVERNLSGSEKLNAALSAISAVQGVKTSLYNTEAAREAAEQSSIKTLNDLVSYRRNARDYELENDATGYKEQNLFKRIFKKRRGVVSQAEIEKLIPEGMEDNSRLSEYVGAYRKKMLSDFARPGVQNRRDAASALGDEITAKYLDEYLDTRNKQQNLDYEIDSNFKNISKAFEAGGPLLQFLAKLFPYLLKVRR